MRRISFVIFPILFLLSLTACGGGGGSSSSVVADTASIVLASSTATSGAAGQTLTLTEATDSTAPIPTSAKDPYICAYYDGTNTIIQIRKGYQGIDLGNFADYETELEIKVTGSSIGPSSPWLIRLGGTDQSDSGAWRGEYNANCGSSAGKSATVTLTAFGDVGGKVTGTFDLTLLSGGIGSCTSNEGHFTGSFNATREASACK